VGLRRLHDGRDSTAATLLVPNGSRPTDLVLKVHKDFAGQSAPPAARARREFEVLCRLQGVFLGESGLGVPRPLHVAHDAVLMQACGGTRLDELVRRARWSGGDQRALLAASMRRTGAWLQTLQRATHREGTGAPEALDRLVARARADLRPAGGQGRPALPAGLDSRIDGLARAAGTAGAPLVGRHGDFWPGNVFVDDGRVHVIDFEGFGEGLPAEDVADFLVSVDLLHAYPGLAGARASLRAAFLEGYGRERLDPALYRLCRMAAALRTLRRAPQATRGPLGAWRRRVLMRMASEG